MKCGYWKYSPRVVKISPREAQPREVIFDHKRWIFPISTFQIVDIHIIHNFMPPCSRLKWELKKKPKNPYFQKVRIFTYINPIFTIWKYFYKKSADIYLHKSNIHNLKIFLQKKVQIFTYINPISTISKLWILDLCR